MGEIQQSVSWETKIKKDEEAFKKKHVACCSLVENEFKEAKAEAEVWQLLIDKKI